MHGGFGYGSRSQEGEDVLNFALAYDLLIANTVFKKRESHLVTFRSGQHSSQIDFILTRREDRRDCLDCKVIPGECCPSTQTCGGGLSSSGKSPPGQMCQDCENKVVEAYRGSSTSV